MVGSVVDAEGRALMEAARVQTELGWGWSVLFYQTEFSNSFSNVNYRL